MAYYKDIREYLEVLDQNGKLRRIKRSINKDTELSPLVRLQFVGLPEEQRSAFVFDNVTDVRGKRYSGSVVLGALGGSEQIYALGMMCKPEEIQEKRAQAERNPIQPKLVEYGPVHEEVHMGDTLLEHGGLEEFPIPILTPGYDPGPAFTAPFWVTKDPDTGVRNVGTFHLFATGGDLMKRLLFIGRSALTAMLIAAIPAITGAQEQAFPNKAVKIVVPYTPGAVTDTAGRAVAQRLSEIWGQPVIVENRPGAGTTIGAEYVAKAAPDGYTLIFADNGTYVITPHLFSKLNYDVLTDFAPITVVFRSTLVFALSNAVPAKDFKEFLAYVKANPGKIVYGSWGSGSNPHLAIEQLKQMAGLDLVHVPYKGGAPALADLLGGRVGLMMASYPLFAPHDKAGKLKVVAVAGEKRLSVRPDIPTVSESGVPGYTMISWFAMMAPAGTPASVLDRIHADVVKVLQDPRADGFTEKYLKAQSLEPGGDSREKFASLFKADYALWGRLVKAVGVKLD